MFKRRGVYYLLFGRFCCFCQEGSGIFVHTASSPLGPWHKPKPVLTDPTVSRIAKAHNVTNAQVGLRWITQQGLTVVTASSSATHDVEDLSLSSFELTSQEMADLDAVVI